MIEKFLMGIRRISSTIQSCPHVVRFGGCEGGGFDVSATAARQGRVGARNEGNLTLGSTFGWLGEAECL
jgi:hypothetical protein